MRRLCSILAASVVFAMTVATGGRSAGQSVAELPSTLPVSSLDDVKDITITNAQDESSAIFAQGVTGSSQRPSSRPPRDTNLWEIHLFDITWEFGLDWFQDGQTPRRRDPNQVYAVSRHLTVPVRSDLHPIDTAAWYNLGLHFLFGIWEPPSDPYRPGEFNLKLIGEDGEVIRSVPFSRHQEYSSEMHRENYYDFVMEYSVSPVHCWDFLVQPDWCIGRSGFLSRWTMAVVHDPPEYTALEVTHHGKTMYEESVDSLRNERDSNINRERPIITPRMPQSWLHGEPITVRPVPLEWSVESATDGRIYSFVYIARDSDQPRYQWVYGPYRQHRYQRTEIPREIGFGPETGFGRLLSGTASRVALDTGLLARLDLNVGPMLVWIAVIDSNGNWGATDPIPLTLG